LENTQLALFQLIKSKLPQNVSFVHEVSELLGLSYDSAYRRIRGEKELTINELEKLSKHFDLSIDTLFQVSGKNVIFTYKALEQGIFELEDWLNSVLDDIKSIHNAKEKRVIYSAVDIPLYHYFHFPEITAFKEYIWLKTLYPSEEYSTKMFKLEDASENFYNIGRQLLATAVKIPTIEIWNEETFNSILRQSEVGYKFPYGYENVGKKNNFLCYYNDLILTDNTILFSSKEIYLTYITNNAINLLHTDSKDYFNRNYHWAKNIVSQSTLISGTAEKERNMFFRELKKKILQTKIELET